MLSKLLHKLGISGGATTSSGDPNALTGNDAEKLLDAFLKEVSKSGGNHPKEYDAGRAILELPREAQAIVAATVCQRLNELVKDHLYGVSGSKATHWQVHATQSLTTELFRRKLSFSESQIETLLQSLTAATWLFWMPSAATARALEAYIASNGLTPRLSSSIKTLIKRLRTDPQGAKGTKLLNRLRVIRDGKSGCPEVQLTRTENWSAAVLDYVDRSKASHCDAWRRLLAHAGAATASKPSQKWLKEAKALIDEVSSAEFRSRLLDWIALVAKGGRLEQVRGTTEETRDRHLLMDEPNARTLKGLVWCATHLENDDEVVHAIGRLGACCYRKIPGYGARSIAVANACVWALGAIPSREAVGQLSFLRSKSKYQAAQHGVAKALHAAAEREGISAEDLEEMAVPKLGLTQIGRRCEALGDYRAELVVEDTHTVALSWLNAKGKPQKSVPADVKRDFAKELKELKSAQKELQKLLPTQRFRIESTFLRRRHWTYAAWRERFIEHPLMGTLARRLVWRFGDGKSVASAIWHDGALVDAGDAKLKKPGDDTCVELWHPVHASVDEIVAWRQWLEGHEVSQPFKQAHRELYILTDAERNTETYSNRFAAHVLRQHQFNALCGERGWQYHLQGAWDSHNTPTIDLLQWEMRAEFWVEPIEHDETTGSGIYSYVSSDQVRFYHLHEPGPQRLEDVPPLVFTEIMRDVDLFVGVSSVGNDPNWGDGGPDGRYHAYWHMFSFGDLSSTAKTRREVLARLIPRLKIADRCSFDDKHLVVRGEYRSYKIHLGSGNILMTPNDAYLCIVPGQRTTARETGKVFLPFEGDHLLSIILSKAILLADDTKITDRTIVSQIRSR